MKSLEVAIEYGFFIKQFMFFESNKINQVFEILDFHDSGVYVLFNEKDECLYVGRSAKVPMRLKQHFPDGSKNIKDFSKQTKRILLLVVDKTNDLNLLEGLMIKLHNPKYNKKQNKTAFYAYLEKKLKKECSQESCSNTSLENGLCKKHGGKGLDWKGMIKKEFEVMHL